MDEISMAVTGLYVLSPEEELLGRPYTTEELAAWRAETFGESGVEDLPPMLPYDRDVDKALPIGEPVLLKVFETWPEPGEPVLLDVTRPELEEPTVELRRQEWLKTLAPWATETMPAQGTSAYEHIMTGKELPTGAVFVEEPGVVEDITRPEPEISKEPSMEELRAGFGGVREAAGEEITAPKVGMGLIALVILGVLILSSKKR